MPAATPRTAPARAPALRGIGRCARSVLAGLYVILIWPEPGALAQMQTKGASGLPLPRYVSLKSDKVNVRIGPGQNYDVAWIFVRAGWPVEIVQEFENWRKIRDVEGAEGWVFHSLLSGRRTALVTPWADSGDSPVRDNADTEAAISAYLEPRVLADVDRCRDNWCKISGDGYSGWIEQTHLWGVYPDEAVDGN